MPDYEKQIKKVRAENPDVADVAIKPAGFMAKLFANKSARAIANPFTGNVTYFPERMASMSEPEQENVFHHELQHSRQARASSPLQKLMAIGKNVLGMEEEYSRRPRELEAFQAEKDRSRRLGLNLPDPYTGARDIQLPPMSARRKPLDYYAEERRRRGLE